MLLISDVYMLAASIPHNCVFIVNEKFSTNRPKLCTESRDLPLAYYSENTAEKMSLPWPFSILRSKEKTKPINRKLLRYSQPRYETFFHWHIQGRRCSLFEKNRRIRSI